MKVYKLVRKVKEQYFPLFIDKHKPFVIGEWFNAEFHPTKGFKPRSLNGFGEDAVGGLHCCFDTVAPHLSEKLATGEQRVWIECKCEGVYQTYKRPWNQGGEWILVEKLKPLREVPWDEVRKRQAEFERQHNVT